MIQGERVLSGSVSFVSGAHLRAARAALGWTQSELGRRAGTHRKAVMYWERRRRIGRGEAHPASALHRFRRAVEAAGLRINSDPPCVLLPHD